MRHLLGDAGGHIPLLALPDRLAVEPRLPTPKEYYDLCVSVGWEKAINFAAAPRSLQNSLHGVTIVDGAPCSARPVGMGRIVGDGAMYFYIQDVIVRPEYQGVGIGRLIVERLMAWLQAHAPDRAFVGLFAAEGRESLYAHLGFLRHPALTGMFYVLHEEDGSLD